MFISISTKRTKLIHIQIYVALLLFAMEFLGVLVQMVAWGLKKVPKKLEEMFTKNDVFFYKKMVIYFFYQIFLLMLQLDELQLRLKSAEFSKPATHTLRIRKKNDETG